MGRSNITLPTSGKFGAKKWNESPAEMKTPPTRNPKGLLDGRKLIKIKMNDNEFQLSPLPSPPPTPVLSRSDTGSWEAFVSEHIESLDEINPHWSHYQDDVELNNYLLRKPCVFKLPPGHFLINKRNSR